MHDRQGAGSVGRGGFVCSPWDDADADAVVIDAALHKLRGTGMNKHRRMKRIIATFLDISSNVIHPADLTPATI